MKCLNICKEDFDGRSGVYEIRNTMTQEVYIGSSSDLGGRLYLHLLSLRSGSHHSYKLQKAWTKYEESCFVFTVLELTANGKDFLIEREQYYMDRLKPYYNVSLKAYSCLGVVRTERTRKKISCALKNKPLSEVRKRKIQSSLRSLYASGYSHHCKGVSRSEDVRAQMSLSQKALNKGRSVLQFTLSGDFVAEFSSAYDTIPLGFKSESVYACCKGQYKQTKGFIFKYKDSEDVNGYSLVSLPDLNRRSRPVFQFNRDGSFVREYRSAAEAKSFGFIPTMISSCCRREKNYVTHRGFIWRYEDGVCREAMRDERGCEIVLLDFLAMFK